MAGQPLVNVDEALRCDPTRWPCTPRRRRRRSSWCAPRTTDLETVVVRPRFVWGRGDTTLLPALIEMVRSAASAGWRRTPSERHDPHRQHRGGPLAGRHQGAGRRRLLRDRRRAGGVPRVHHADARHPGRRHPRTSRSRPGWRGSRPPQPSAPGACSSGRARRRSPASRYGSPRRSARSTSRAPSASSATPVTTRERSWPRSGLDGGAHQAHEERVKRPIEISSPSSSSASSTRSPLRKTPFRLRSSSMRAPLASR